MREAKQKEAAKRRESMAVRTETARAIKEVEQDLEEKTKEEELDIMNLRYDSWVSEKEYKKMESSKRRESLAGRLDIWRQHKHIETDEKLDELNQSIEEINLRRDDWTARNEYKKDQDKKTRESIADRLNKWREENAQIKLSKTEQMEAERYDFELRAQEHLDVTNYKAQLEIERRESLAYRLASAREDKNWERGQIALLAIAAEESRQLEEEDRACVSE